MALASIIVLVKQRLPFLPQGADATLDPIIESMKLEEFYFMQKWTGISNDDVEDESKYTGLLRFLIVRLVCYDLIARQIVQVVGGVSGSSSVAEGTKRIKRAKADVVEAEFDYAKASDGSVLSATSTDILNTICKEICSYAAALSYFNLPMCLNQMIFDVPPFIGYENPNLKSCCD